jgi:hypothetical protein
MSTGLQPLSELIKTQQKRTILRVLKPEELLITKMEATQDNFNIVVEEGNLPLLHHWKEQHKFKVTELSAVRSGVPEIFDLVTKRTSYFAYSSNHLVLEEVAKLKFMYYLHVTKINVIRPEFVRAGWIEGIQYCLDNNFNNSNDNSNDNINDSSNDNINDSSNDNLFSLYTVEYAIVEAINCKQWLILQLLLAKLTDEYKLQLDTEFKSTKYKITYSSDVDDILNHHGMTRMFHISTIIDAIATKQWVTVKLLMSQLTDKEKLQFKSDILSGLYNISYSPEADDVLRECGMSKLPYFWLATEHGMNPGSGIGYVLSTDVVRDNVGSEGEGYDEDIIYSRTHESGWQISAKICNDYYTWVEKFTAIHPIHGKISGSYGSKVIAESELAFNHFFEHHPFHEFDYGDI